jgi:glycerol-3-phosphate acyltransferase PlsY
MGFLLMIIICYLIGSIPCGYLIGKRNNIDIRRYGSGNIGATNAFRVLGTQLGLLVLFCDAVKGFLPVLIVNNIFGPSWGAGAGLAAIVGHSWSIFLGFRGGRGVLIVQNSLPARDSRGKVEWSIGAEDHRFPGY